MKILFEANSIIPNKSGGIEYFLYHLVNSWKKYYPEDEIFIHISPDTKDTFLERIGENMYVIDPFHEFFQGKIKKVSFLNRLLSLVEVIPVIKNFTGGMRKKWIRNIDKMVDVIIYPFQREIFIHDPSKLIFIMHDFRMMDLPGGSQLTILNQQKAIMKSAYTVCSWPYPFKRLNQLFPKFISKFCEIPFLYDPIDLENEDTVVGNFLYYPAGLALHKNHKNLIIGLYHYNRLYNKNLRLICTGPENASLREECLDLSASLGLSNSIDFLGFVDRRKVFKLYNECFAVITPTLYEAVGGPILEAFRFEKPVLASAIPPHEDFLKKYKLKIELFDPKKPMSIALSIDNIVQNYNFNMALSKEGKSALKFITPEYTISQYHKLASLISTRVE
jgi:glycosyltransferase involved in cell wall biosynthesis